MIMTYMKNKKIFGFLIAGMLLHISPVYGQDNNKILQLIEQNNTQLKAARKSTSAETMDNKTGLNLKNPEIEFSHKWNTKHPNEKGKELGITQELEWDVISGQRKKLARSKNELSEMQFQQTRTSVMADAQMKLVELSYHNNMIKELQLQLQHADSLVNIYETLLQNGNGNVLDVNRSKLNKTSILTELQNLNAQKKCIIESLCNMNDGKELPLADNFTFTMQSIPENFEAWFKSIEPNIPDLNYQNKNIEIMKKNVQTTKSEMIPSLSIGYRAEFSNSESMHGFAIGMSIPLWENKNKVKKSKLEVEVAQSNAKDKYRTVYDELKKQYILSVELKESLQKQQQALNELNTVTLMNEALQKGEINLMDYLNETARYYELRKNKIQTEKDFLTAISLLHIYEL